MKSGLEEPIFHWDPSFAHLLRTSAKKPTNYISLWRKQVK